MAKKKKNAARAESGDKAIDTVGFGTSTSDSSTSPAVATMSTTTSTSTTFTSVGSEAGLKRRKRANTRTTATDTADLSSGKIIAPSAVEYERPVGQRRCLCVSAMLLGILVGMLIAFAVIKERHEHMEESDMGQIDQAFAKLIRLAPNGRNFTDPVKLQVERTLRALKSVYSPGDSSGKGGDFDAERPGLTMRLRGIQPKHHVVFVPGVVSTGLELWQGYPCAERYFRQRLWGTLSMVQSMLGELYCWMQHVSMNETTFLDPANIKLRPAQGHEAADYLMPNFWVWSKVQQNLADVGYDPNSMHMASYDWRLPIPYLEKRDRWMTNLQLHIESVLRLEGRKTVSLCHSYGANIFYYFLQWVESPLGGNGGPGWVERHIEAFVPIGGPLLGTAKGQATMLSGEMRDTAYMGGAMQVALDKFVSRSARLGMLRTWGSGPAMMAKGQDRIWGDLHSAPDDTEANLREGRSFGRLMDWVSSETQQQNMTMSAYYKLLATMPEVQVLFDKWYSYGVEKDPATSRRYETDPRLWTNPLESPLPRAPSMKIWCLYGWGKPTERAYVYQDAPEEWRRDMTMNTTANPVADFPYMINQDASNDAVNLTYGVMDGEGDGTVPLMSLGYMCVKGWKRPSHNPGDVKLGVREYLHRPSSSLFEPRGGPLTSDHVDIMGNHLMIEDVIRIVAGEDLDDVIYSPVREYAERVNWEWKDGAPTVE